MSEDFQTIGTDEIKSVVGGATPFAVGGINGNRCYWYAVEEVVGVVRTVVTRYFYLRDKETA